MRVIEVNGQVVACDWEGLGRRRGVLCRGSELGESGMTETGLFGYGYGEGLE